MDRPRLEKDILAAICCGCPPTGLSGDMFSSFAARTLFELYRHERPAPELIAPIVQTATIHPLYRPECESLAGSIADEVRSSFQGSVIGVRHFDVNVRALAGLHRQDRAAAWVKDLARRVDAGEDLDRLARSRLADAWQGLDSGRGPVPIDQLQAAHPSLRESIVNGIGRRGEVVNVVSGTKIGKTWLTHGLALLAATGQDWFGFAINGRRNVLVLDNELHAETLAWRVRQVAEAMDLRADEYAPRLRAMPCRGQGVDVTHLPRIASSCGSWRPDLVVLDSLYRFMPAGSPENDNTAMTRVIEQVISFADELGAMVAVVHHSSKGDQADRAVTDVGSGAGSLSRAADTHLILRQHREPSCAVLDARCRSFEQPEARVIRWQFPLWKLAEGLDAGELHDPRKQKQEAADAEAVAEVVDAVLSLCRDGRPATQTAIIEATQMRRDRIRRLLGSAVKGGQLRRLENTKNPQWTAGILDPPADF